MKIRNGFVSNSSSSSFVIFGIRVNTKELSNEDIKNNKYTVIGDYFEGGYDVFEIDNEETLKFIKAVETLYKKTPFRVYKNIAFEGKNDLSKLPKEGTAELICGDAEQSSSYNINRLFENYTSEWLDNNFDQETIKNEMSKI